MRFDTKARKHPAPLSLPTTNDHREFFLTIMFPSVTQSRAHYVSDARYYLNFGIEKPFTGHGILCSEKNAHHKL